MQDHAVRLEPDRPQRGAFGGARVGQQRDALVGVRGEDDPMFVTLNPDLAIRPECVMDETVFRHPVFDHAALQAQSTIAALQGTNRTWFAGAWLRNGFHEDGFASALRIARRLLPERVRS